MAGRSFILSRRPLVYLGGQKAAVSDSVEGWSAAVNLGASRVSIRMDDRTDGQRDNGTDSGCGRREEASPARELSRAAAAAPLVQCECVRMHAGVGWPLNRPPAAD
jgi:hypothetical protein